MFLANYKTLNNINILSASLSQSFIEILMFSHSIFLAHNVLTGTSWARKNTTSIGTFGNDTSLPENRMDIDDDPSYTYTPQVSEASSSANIGKKYILEPRRSPSDDEILDLTALSSSTGRVRLPYPKKEPLRDPERRTACDIAIRHESEKKYAAIRKQDMFKCKLCGVFLHSAAICEAYRKGKEHKARVKRAREGPRICHYCNIAVRSNSEFDNHIRGRKHKKICRKNYGLREDI